MVFSKQEKLDNIVLFKHYPAINQWMKLMNVKSFRCPTALCEMPVGSQG